MKQLIQQGAEAKIYLITPLPTTDSKTHKSDEVARRAPADPNIIEQSSTILKQRTKKSYRHPTLDEQIRKSRTKKESKLLTKANSLKINTPKILNTEKFDLKLEYLNGEKLSETLNDYNKDKQNEVMKKLGKETSKLHTNEIIHGDLTTSNVILLNNETYIIDFGLGFISNKTEDKAVDIHLIKQALIAKHFQNNIELFNNFLEGYKSKESNEVIKRLETVEKRGRYKH
jgi:Kae1-associated kinase Bud32